MLDLFDRLAAASQYGPQIPYRRKNPIAARGVVCPLLDAHPAEIERAV
jgi:hypothetical protein